MGPRGGQENGWGRRIRTPAAWSRATCPTTRRSPSALRFLSRRTRESQGRTGKNAPAIMRAARSTFVRQRRRDKGETMDSAAAVMYVIAAFFTLVAYYRSPDLPLAGLTVSWELLKIIAPRLVAALILTGMLQVIIPQEMVSRYIGREAGFRGILIASAAGVITPGGPMVAGPLGVALSPS